MSVPSLPIFLLGMLSLTTGALLGGSSAQAQSNAAITMDICPNNLNGIPDGTPSLTCGCSAEQASKDSTIWGDNPYATMLAAQAARVCRAAVHAGAIGLGGGQITITFEPEANFFPATTRNDVESASMDGKGGFRVVNASKNATPSPVAGAAITMDICPDDLNGIPDGTPSLTCGCSAEQASKDSTIWGDNPYATMLAAQAARVCRAAVHAGAIGVGGGQITISFEPEANFFPATTRNDVESASMDGKGGFRVVNASKNEMPSPIAGAAITMDICPDDLNGIPDGTPSLTCGCSAEQASKDSTIWGDNPYATMLAAQAARVCRAAVHAGAIGVGGGQITISFEPEASFFPATTRNGVESASTDGKGGFRVAVAPKAAAPAAGDMPSVDAAGQPIQAPIAETLKAVGKVQLYVNFATDQDRPLPSSEPVLNELLKTLQENRDMRVTLIGHTDSQGSAPYNLDLSQRRSASVYLWLIQHGMEPGRLRSDGRGFLEPIADNATESGRALNRRVEVKTLTD